MGSEREDHFLVAARAHLEKDDREQGKEHEPQLEESKSNEVEKDSNCTKKYDKNMFDDTGNQQRFQRWIASFRPPGGDLDEHLAELMAHSKQGARFFEAGPEERTSEQQQQQHQRQWQQQQQQKQQQQQ